MTKTIRKQKKTGTVSKKSPYSLTKPSFFYSFIILAFAIIALLIAANIQTTHNLTGSAQNVLGENEQNEEQEHEEEKEEEKAEEKEKEHEEEKAEEAHEERAKQTAEQQKEAEKKITRTIEPSEPPRTSIKSKTETMSPNGLQLKTESVDKKQETEIETEDGQKIKTKIEDDGTSKIEIENGTVKLKYRMVNGQIVLNVENEEGEEVEIEDDELEELENEVEEQLEDEDVKLVPTTNNQLALTQHQIAAFTDFPLSINVETKELIITTPAGQKTVTVLPNEAVQNLLATGVVSSIETPSSDIAAQDQLGTLTGVVEIETRNNETVYKIKGKKTHRILGLFPVAAPVTAFVSTDTGLPIAKQQSILTNVVEFLSP